MFPEIIHIGPVVIRTYGFFIAIGFFFALQYLLKNARSTSLSAETVYDISVAMLIAGLIGGRIMYVVLNWTFYRANPLAILRVWEGGLVFYGGLVAGGLALAMYFRSHRQYDFWRFVDILAPALALAHFFGRLGCFCAGCCYGSPTTLPWSVTFQNWKALAPVNVPLHPVQLYEAFSNLLLFFMLDAYNRSRHPAGYTMGAYLFFYGLMRFHMEFLRGDDRGMPWLGMSPSQLVSLGVIIMAVVLMAARRQHHHD